ncbi:hypothetical protein D356_00737 [Enterococcus faecium SD2A-2]|uniref:Uncharacterized protein n=1 Tax=Enterococcus faecium SD2A-2 TaxID=1244154 RepID=A0AB73ACV3_ENTFC|nr:hypothetical protein D356_00737 [Enterococcus faecium SD2A-2]KXA10126.1 hypothetical protein HMPREF3199_00945 [Enterococcus faecium]
MKKTSIIKESYFFMILSMRMMTFPSFSCKMKQLKTRSDTYE